MAYKFKNYSGKHKFTGNFIYNSETYEYSLYLPAFDEDTKKEVIDYFGDRKQNGRICLDVDKKVVEAIKIIRTQLYINKKDDGNIDYRIC